MKGLKIAFTGAESTGKTTLVNELKKRFPELPVVSSLTRTVEGYLSKTNDVQKALLAAYAAKLMEHQYEGYICDRTIFDVCAYSKAKGVWDDKYIKGVLDMYTKTSIFPDYLFYLPIEFDMVQDGGRPEGTREEIDAHIKLFIDTHALNDYIVITGTVEERLEKILYVLEGRI